MHAARLERLRSHAPPVVVLTHPDSLCYFVGFQTPGGSLTAAVVRGDAITIVVRDLEARHVVPVDGCTLTVRTYAEDDPALLLAALLAALPLGDCTSVGYEAQCPRMTAAARQRLCAALPPDVAWTDVSAAVRRQRAVKEEWELGCMRRAAGFVEAALKKAPLRAFAGAPETLLAARLALAKGAAGSEWTAYPDFVSAGPRGCVSHKPAVCGARVPAEGLVFVEVGASHARYHAARMHTEYVGRPPPWYAPLERALRRAVREGAAAARPGAAACDVDARMRRIVAEAAAAPGTPPLTMHRRSGYSIGLGNDVDWADGVMRLDPTSADVLEAGVALHMIPWVCVEGHGSMGFSDVVVVADAPYSLFTSETASRCLNAPRSRTRRRRTARSSVSRRVSP